MTDRVEESDERPQMTEDQKEQLQTPGTALIKSIADSDLGDLGIDIGENFIDALLNETISTDIPVLRSILGIVKAGRTIRDYYFVKKVVRFLKGLDDIPEQERRAVCRTLEADQKTRGRWGETLLLVLDRYDHLDKPAMMADLFKGFTRGEIGFDEFLRFSSAIDRAFIEDLRQLLRFFSGETKGADKLWPRLFAVGLSKLKVNIEIVDDEGPHPFDQTLKVRRFTGFDEEAVGYEWNIDAARMADVILGDEFQHPGGFIWDGERYQPETRL